MSRSVFYRRSLRFSLAALLVTISVVGVLLALVVNRVRFQERIIAEVERLGGRITFADDLDDRPQWLRHMLGDEYFREVNGVYLDQCEASDDLVEQISYLPHVEHLSVAQTKITNDSLRHASRLKQLKALTVSFNEITNDALSHLAPLDELLYLDLDVTSVTDEGLPALRQLSQLYHLKLYGNPITNEGAARLSQIRSLGELDLGNTKITDEGLLSLAELPNLTRLRLDQMITGQGQELRITDTGLRNLAGARRLRDLGLVNFPVTDRGIADLKKARPGLQIQR